MSQNRKLSFLPLAKSLVIVSQAIILFAHPILSDQCMDTKSRCESCESDGKTCVKCEFGFDLYKRNWKDPLTRETALQTGCTPSIYARSPTCHQYNRKCKTCLYKDPSICLRCDTGYQISSDRKKCTKPGNAQDDKPKKDAGAGSSEKFKSFRRNLLTMVD